jgi:hypothetical protein
MELRFWRKGQKDKHQSSICKTCRVLQSNINQVKGAVRGGWNVLSDRTMKEGRIL